MPGIRLKHVERFKDRHGQIRWYFRKGHGKRVALSGEPGTFEFRESYERAAGSSAASVRPAPAEGTVGAVIAAYYGSTGFLAQKPTTRVVTRRILDTFADEHGAAPIATFRREHVDIIIGRKSATPGAAIILLQKIRVIVRFAIGRGWLDHDPTLGIKAFKSKEYHTWTEQEITKFEKHWPLGTVERTAFAPHIHTGQRRSDVCKMQWADITGDSISVTQMKTGAELTIPVHPALRKTLAVAKRAGPFIVGTISGRQRSLKAYGGLMADAIAAAGLPVRCVLHGLRKAAARRLAEAGCSASQIAAVTGHKTLAEVERYTRAAGQELMARDAILGLGKRRKAKQTSKNRRKTRQ